jgi:nitrite reductase/ring-hydroxylating ferredoxin subunit
VRVGKRRIALYRRQGRVFALSNVCRHQGGPIGEGRIVDGCITCPWHGWQYRPEDGASPPPFNEKIPTFPVAVRDGQVYVNPEPLPQGTVSEGALLSGSAGRIDRAAMERASAWFYIGYRKTLSPAITHFVQTSAVIILLACPLFMAVMAAAQHHPDYGTFEFGQAYTLEGVLYAEPVPSLYVRPTTGGAGYHLLLCGQGKFGIPASWHGHHGQKVSLRGTPIYRDNVAMIEAGPEQDLQVLGAPSAHEERPESEDLGLVTLVGELVDTKCYLGVMRPATGKVHRACAIRCLSGGVPPGIRIQAYGRETVLLLAGPAEKALEYDVTWAGRLIEVEGSLQRQDGFSFVRVSRMSLLEAPAGA